MPRDAHMRLTHCRARILQHWRRDAAVVLSPDYHSYRVMCSSDIATSKHEVVADVKTNEAW